MKSLGSLVLILVPAMAMSDIQPQDGVWSGQGQFIGESGCPAQIADAMAQQSGSYDNQQMTFPKPFDPVPLVNSDIAWSKIGTDTWRGVFTQSQNTQMGAISASTVFDITVTSETEISQSAKVQVEMPQTIAQLLGMSGASCAIQTVVTHRYGG